MTRQESNELIITRAQKCNIYDMNIVKEQYFLDQANLILERVLGEAFNQAKNGASLFVFTSPSEPRVVEKIKIRLLELGYEIEVSDKEIMFEW